MARITVTSGVWIDVDRRCGSTTSGSTTSLPPPPHTHTFTLSPTAPDYCNRIPPRVHEVRSSRAPPIDNHPLFMVMQT
ncbi:unnamed protein product [Danaus chrysippus]|uniref:(African queen) hypothetical protein n=1 Tax=Danaus chrysippus TaxID=151541 RepID=A0A8J2QE96_9NEOP|nr:unnamed protein product [Danaus chrysippus]